MKFNISTYILTENPEAALQVAAQEGVAAKQLLMRYISWLLIVSYTLLMCKPVMPVVADVIAHTFWEKQHLMTVHEVNGKFHVHYEIAKNEKQSNKDNNSTQKDEVNLHMPTLATLIQYVSFSFAAQTHLSLYRRSFPLSHTEKDYPPPRVA